MSLETNKASIVTVVLASAFAFAIGGVVGFITTFTHRALPPWGLVAGLVIIAAAVLGFRLVFASRIIGVAAAVGAIAATALLTLPGAGGTAFVIADPLGVAWAIGPAVLSAIALAWPKSAWRRKAADPT